MATILDELVSRIDDPALREQVAEQVSLLQGEKQYGLVFPRHLPEKVRLPNHPVRRRTVVALRDGSSDETWVVKAVKGKNATLLDAEGTETTRAEADLVVIRRFGEPVFPGLTSVGKAERGGDKPCHTVVNAENYHALETLLYTHEGKVDLIYIDPPYNTGATDWKYNNDYVDKNDTYRHSKWLSFMEKRLVMAKRLLKENGILVLTIDENEVHHIGVLLEALFPTALRQMVSIAINPSGASGEGLSRVEEYAIFVFQGDARPCRVNDNLLTATTVDTTATVSLTWESLLRRGNSWYRTERPNMCYPVLVDPKTHAIKGVGKPFEGEDESKRPTKQGDLDLAWPVRKDGRLGIWRKDGKGLTALIEKGYAYASGWDKARGTWSLKYLMSGMVTAIDKGDIVVERTGQYGQVVATGGEHQGTMAKTMWVRGRHIAGGAGGTQMVSALLGVRGGFTYPKSVYAVLDTLEICVGKNPDAVILDFFAGTGTTLHATALLNSRDGGRRQAIIITNNEVNGATAAELTKAGHHPGDPAWEARGVFHSATKPRCLAAITGERPDGNPVEGQYDDGTDISDGLDENVELFDLSYLDRNDVERGQAFSAIAPLLWLEAGGRGERIDTETADFSISESGGYAILFDVGQWASLSAELDQKPDVRLLFIVTDSLAQYQQIVAELSPEVQTKMLYEDYLENFELNTGGAL